MSELQEMQALSNTPCIISDKSGNDFKCSFPDVSELIGLQGKAKEELLEDTKKTSRAMKEGGASQSLIDKVWNDYQEKDDKTTLEKCLLNPAMFKDLIRICIKKNHSDITLEKVEELLTFDNLEKITNYFSRLKSVINITEEQAKKN